MHSSDKLAKREISGISIFLEKEGLGDALVGGGTVVNIFPFSAETGESSSPHANISPFIEKHFPLCGKISGCFFLKKSIFQPVDMICDAYFVVGKLVWARFGCDFFG